MEMETKIKELAMSDHGTTLVLLIDQVRTLRDGLVRRSQIMDSQILASRRIQEDMQKVVEEWREELIQFRADRQLCARLNLIIEPQKTREQTWQKEKSSNQHHMLKKYARGSL
jgi:hypothetical protein